MSARDGNAIIIRELTSSDLGWFAEPQDSGRVASKQRAINFNAAVVAAILPRALQDAQEVKVRARCLRAEALHVEDRPLAKVGKNWRLGGRKVRGEIFGKAQPGDLFICQLNLDGKQPFDLSWTVVMQATDPTQHAALAGKLAPRLKDGMTLFSDDDNNLVTLFASLLAAAPPAAEPEKKVPAPPKVNPLPKRSARKLGVRERLKQPHILSELLKLSLSQSSEAQKEFLAVLETLASGIREMLEAADLIRSVKVDHQATWKDVAGAPISFVDGGMANIASMGAEPVAIRVGSFTVIPGRKDSARESFRMEKQTVMELFDLRGGGGLFDDLFEDPSKLREAARFCLELAGGVECLRRDPKPKFLFLHGALVNPVSAYADKNFPAFSKRGLEVLLPPTERNRQGRDAMFVCVYLRLLQMLMTSGVNVTSVVERASQSTLVSRTLLEQLKNSPVSPGPAVLDEAIRRIEDFRITDSVLFHAIMNEGEYLVPVPVDRNVANKRPQFSADVIGQYPLPFVTYLGVGEFAQPLRVEFFDEPPVGYDQCLRLVLHSCRLMPNYAFPAGLDIVDKFAKVPDWMSRPISTGMAVQLLKRAIDTGNPKIIEAAKRMLCGTKRDWLFRPNFNP